MQSRNYRLVLLLKSSLKKEPKDKLLDEVEKIYGAKKAKRDSLGDKKLAYVIKGNKTADYTVLNFESDNITPDLDKKLLINEDIVRHLLVRD